MSEIKTITLTTLEGINEGDKRTHLFDVDFTDVNPKFKGRFIVHQPNLMEQLKIGRVYTALTGGLPVDQHTDNIATILSTLDIVIDEKPEWFIATDASVDYPIMEAVYMEYLEWTNTFRKPNKPSDNESNSGDQPS
jgi:hypothetical protein